MANVELQSFEIFNEHDFNKQLKSNPEQLLSLLKQTIQKGQQALKQAFEADADTLALVIHAPHSSTSY